MLVSLEPGDRRVTTRLGDWRLEKDRLLLTRSPVTRGVDMTVPGQLTLELAEEPVPGREFVRLRADYRTTVAPVTLKPALPRVHRRFVIA